jgi:DNA-binding MarR family transcriptional regulator
MTAVLSDLEGVALASRLIRLGELIRKDVARLYKEYNIAWEPKWSPVLLILMDKAPMGIQELADELGYAHPSVIALVKEMEAKKLIRSSADKTDKRRRMLSLTPKALAAKEALQPVCDIMNAVVQDITGTKHPLLRALDETEQLLAGQNFFSRCIAKKAIK